MIGEGNGLAFGPGRIGAAAASALERIDFVNLLNQPCPAGLALRVDWHQLVVAFQRRVQSGTVDDHAGVAVVAHLLESERATDHVAGKALPAVGVGGIAADPVVHREAGVTPPEHAFSESGIQHAFRTQEIRYLVSPSL